MDGSKSSLEAARTILNDFYYYSGLKMNIEKTLAVWLGNKTGTDERICREYNLNWTNEPFNILGVTLSASLHNLLDLNGTNKLKQIQLLLQTWKWRKLILQGKITIIKTLALSELAHLLIVLPNPSKWFTKQKNKLFFKFLWNDGPDRIRRQVVTQTYAKGGLKMVAIAVYTSSLKLSWIRLFWWWIVF